MGRKRQRFRFAIRRFANTGDDLVALHQRQIVECLKRILRRFHGRIHVVETRPGAFHRSRRHAPLGACDARAARQPLQNLLGDRIDLLIRKLGHVVNPQSSLLRYLYSPPTSQLSTIAITTASTGRFCVATVCRAELPVA